MKTTILQAGILFLLGTGLSARADTFTLNFTSLTEGLTMATTQTAVDSYIHGVLGSAGTVTETGGITDNGYTADGHVVGPNNGGFGSATSYTLANKDGGTFLVNDNLNSGSNDIKFVFNLTSGAVITGVSFDYEIFPDIGCPNPGSCSETPDIELAANGVTKFTALAIEPGQPGGSSNVYSPTDPWFFSPEQAPQLLGHASVTSLNATTLDFIDWPATIGINDVVITTSGTSQTNGAGTVPEPASIVLLGTIASLVMFKLRRLQA